MNVGFGQGDWGKPQDFFVAVAEDKTPDVPTKIYILVTQLCFSFRGLG